MEILTATDARKNFFEIVKTATEKHIVYRIKHRKGSVVIISEEEYDSLVETLELLSIPGFKESMKRSVNQVKKGESVSYDDVFGED
jgi:antitoxin YefM